MPTIAPYGSWKSPITADLIVARTIYPAQLSLDEENVYWSELRPEEQGRIAIVKCLPDGQTIDVLPPPYNARSRVHEYGGGSYLVRNGVILFSNFDDQRLYRLSSEAEPQPLTPSDDLRYADYVLDARRGRLICVREDHRASDREAVNTIVSVDLHGGDLERGGRILISGNDFYSSPRLSPDGTHLAWLTWNHPNMPWDGTELWVAEVTPEGALENQLCVVGGPSESIFQPEWSPDGFLYFVSDRTGWWNLYRWEDGQIKPLCPMEAEFGEPQWVLGMSNYAFETADRLICIYTQRGQDHLATLNTRNLAFEEVHLPFTAFNSIQAKPGSAWFIAGSASEARSVVHLDLSKGKHVILRASMDLTIDPGYISQPQPIEFPTENGLTAHAIYYPPCNRDFLAPEGERPPLVVKSHGGPTGATTTTLNLEIQYWTSRGFAVLDVNYGGSSGYGRAYRDRLKGQWGIVDVDDCVNGARYLVQHGKADEKRLAISGGSAGGYTTLCALAFRKEFKAGASHFGISDVEALAKDTHKFESRYLDNLIGPYPEARDRYVSRSPIHFAHQMDCALILFQGSEDKIVPPDQSRKMFETLRAKGLPTAYLEFEGEQHGFRRAENIKRALEGELYFYSRVFGFELADSIEPVEIENLARY